MTTISQSLASPASIRNEPKSIQISITLNYTDDISISMKPLRDKGRIFAYEVTLPTWSDAKCPVSHADRLRRFDAVVCATNPKGLPTDYTAARAAFVKGFVKENWFVDEFRDHTFYLPVGN